MTNFVRRRRILLSRAHRYRPKCLHWRKLFIVGELIEMSLLNERLCNSEIFVIHSLRDLLSFFGFVMFSKEISELLCFDNPSSVWAMSSFLMRKLNRLGSRWTRLSALHLVEALRNLRSVAVGNTSSLSFAYPTILHALENSFWLSGLT